MESQHIIYTKALELLQSNHPDSDKELANIVEKQRLGRSIPLFRPSSEDSPSSSSAVINNPKSSSLAKKPAQQQQKQPPPIVSPQQQTNPLKRKLSREDANSKVVQDMRPLKKTKVANVPPVAFAPVQMRGNGVQTRNAGAIPSPTTKKGA